MPQRDIVIFNHSEQSAKILSSLKREIQSFQFIFLVIKLLREVLSFRQVNLATNFRTNISPCTLAISKF